MIEAIADPRARLNRADLQYSGIETPRGLQVHGLRQGRDSKERDTCTHHVSVAGARQEGAGTVRDGPRHRGQMRGYGLEHVELRSEEHTSELQPLMSISYAVIGLNRNTTP